MSLSTVNGDETKITKSFGVISFLRQLTIEPAVLLVYTTALVNYVFSQNIILQQSCLVNLNYSSDICEAISQRSSMIKNLTNEENAIQVIAANVRTYRSLFDNLLPIFAVLFFGPWSDRHGRKFPMLLSTFGFVMQSVSLLIFSLMKNVDAYTVGLVASFVASLFGTLRVFCMAATSYATDNSTLANRTLRIGILSSCMSAGVPLGFSIGGALASSSLASHYSLAIAGAIGSLAFFMLLFVVDNSTLPKEGQINSSTNPIKNVIQVTNVVLKKREEGKRMGIILLLISIGCIAGPQTGEYGVMFLFLMKRLGWDSGQYSHFSSYQSVVLALGSLLSVGILSQFLKLSDPVVGFVSGISQLTSCFIYAFAYNTFMIFLAPAVDLMNGTMAICAQSIATKLVTVDETGKLFSFIGLIELLAILAIDPLYSTLYQHTLGVFAGSFWFLSALLSIPPQLTFLWFIIRQWRKENKEDEHATENIDCNNSELGGRK